MHRFMACFRRRVVRAAIRCMSALLAIMIGAATPLAGAGPAAGPATQPAGEPIAPAQTTAEPAWYNVHAQATVITEKHDAFPAPYAGRNSLERIEPMRTSVTATLFLGARAPWTGGQLYFCLLYTSDAADDLLCVDLG